MLWSARRLYCAIRTVERVPSLRMSATTKLRRLAGGGSDAAEAAVAGPISTVDMTANRPSRACRRLTEDMTAKRSGTARDGSPFVDNCQDRAAALRAR